MEDQNEHNASNPSDAKPDEQSKDATSSRREFIGRVARKAIYVAPAVMVLNGNRAVAMGSVPCYPAGSPCATGTDCCSMVCVPVTMMCQ